jgi:general secretion pathway protein D
MRSRACLTLAALLLVASGAGAQGTTPGVRRSPAGYMLDFENQDLTTVLSALAEAAGVNVTFSTFGAAGVPAGRVTLHMNTPVPRDSLPSVMRSIATSNGLRVVQEGTLWRVERVAVDQPPQRFQPQVVQPPQIELFTYRLKHANAQELAQVLTTVFTGGVVNRGFTINVPGGVQVNPNPGPQILTPQGLVPLNPTTPGGVTVVPDVTVTQGARQQQQQQRPGQGANPNPGQALRDQLLSQLAQSSGALSSAASEVRVVAEISTNSLIVRATQQDWLLIRRIVDAIDLRPLQVLIEVTIAEVQRTSTFNLGVTGTATRKPDGSTGDTQVLTAPNNTGTDRDLVLQLTGGGGAIDFNVAIHALSERGDVRVLSLPIVIAQNNKQAVLNVGSSRPFVSITQTVPNDPTSRVQTVQYVDVSTKLTITPIINPDGYVNLTVDQTDDAATNEVQFSAPVITRRQATTQVFLRDGQTTVIGGLAGRTRNSRRSGIPLLSSIPVLGGLFGGTTRTNDTSELFLFLTPHVVAGDADIDRLRDALKDGSVLLKQQDLSPIIREPTADTLGVPPRDSTRVPAPSPAGAPAPRRIPLH